VQQKALCRVDLQNGFCLPLPASLAKYTWLLDQPLYLIRHLSIAMLKNYLTIALRNLVRQKVFSTINILGLALGMATSLLIGMWVQDERRVDNFHANGKQLYCVYTRSHIDGKVSAEHITSALLADELKKVVPEVERASAFWYNRAAFRVGDRIGNMHGIQAGVHFFTMFSYPLLAGSAQSALVEPNGVAISRKMAEMYFGSPQAALGKTMGYDNRKELMVTAVFEDAPAQSSLQFDYALNVNTWLAEKPFMKSWDFTLFRTYLQLREGADPRKVEARIEHLLDAYVKQNANFRLELGLQRFGDTYLYSNFEGGRPGGGRIHYVRLFTGVAGFMLLIACINFMNLATARTTKRAKEVGVRKAIGSSRVALIGQFIGEAMLLAFVGVVISLLLVALVLPGFNGMAGKAMALPVGEPSFWLLVAGLVGITGMVAGSYPALFLSSLQPLQVMKGTLKTSSGAIWFRKGLVVFQFVLSILLLIATVVVTRQTQYVQNKNLGFDRENLIYTNIEGELETKYSVFKAEALRMPGIKEVDRSMLPPHDMGLTTKDVTWEGKSSGPSTMFAAISVGFDFVKLMRLQVVEGRDFSKTFATDTSNFLINEVAADVMGFKDPVGKLCSVKGKKGKIIGVLKNFHSLSLHNPIQPVILDVKEDSPYGVCLIRTEPGKTREALASLKQLYQQFNPALPFSFYFADEEYAQQYKSEQLVTRLSHAFAGLAIFISCLGLLGLAMFSAEQRTKEMGVRRVFGASELSILTLFAKDFLKLVGISFLIAAPVAGLSMRSWLEGFAYRISLSPWIFAFAAGVALLIALLTVGIQAVKIAFANPAESMRNE
jgi:ABC-type antimicrobial peptide transport system permease subunit